MKKIKLYTKIIIHLILIQLLLACSSTHTPHLLFYQSTNNSKINLLEWKYSNHQQSHISSISNSLPSISLESEQIDNQLKIKWINKDNNKIQESTIPIQGLPLNMKNAEIRLIFNKENQPEIFVFYDGPNPYVKFWFDDRHYVKNRVRKIFPEIKEIKINAQQIN